MSVVKRPFIQRGDLGISSRMVRMTFSAGPSCLHPTVKSNGFLDVFGDVLVASAAEFVLCGFVERLVAFFALGFPLGVPFDDRSWHQQQFEGAGPNKGCGPTCQCKKETEQTPRVCARDQQGNH
ncbi:hypothetical protein D6833_11455 [Candidatus Parcubacteria bacterium]|nr:MAG: hypothetical protein D6833_11455 [Candidatus Parcubacteria bacterium]